MYFKEENLEAHKLLSSIENIDEKDKYRLAFHTEELKDGYWAMNALYYNFRTFQSQFVPQIYKQWTQFRHADKFENYRTLTGARWHIYSKDKKPENKRFVPLNYENDIYKIYENPDAWPQAFIADAIAPFDKDFRKFLRHTSNINVKKKTAFLSPDNHKKIKSFIGDNNQNSKNSISLKRINHNKLQYDVTVNENELFVINEYFNKYWEIKIDDKIVEPIQVNFNQIGLELTEGKHTIIASYRPKIFIFLKYLQNLTFIGFLGLFGFQCYNETKPSVTD